MIKILLLFVSLNLYAIEVPEIKVFASLLEKKQGNIFLQAIWDTGKITDDIEAQIYLKTLGRELSGYSNNPDKHFDFFILQDNSINAFAGPYGYIGVHTGALLSSESEAELAGVLSHEIAHITQNHLYRFSKKTDKQGFLVAAGILAAVLAKNSQVSKAITSSTLAGVVQQNINFTREHEWEADRIGLKILLKSGFNPKGMADFFAKLKDNGNAKEFLRTHPLSINRVADSIQRSQVSGDDYRPNSFEYTTIRAKIYYQQYQRIEMSDNPDIKLYMQAYQAFEKQKYPQAKAFIDKLLEFNKDNPSYILAGRIYSKLGDINKAQKYFAKKSDHQANAYYAAKAYVDNGQTAKGAQLLKRYLRVNSGVYQAHQFLSLLFANLSKSDRVHIHGAQALVAQGRLQEGIDRYQRAKSVTHSQDVRDVLDVKIGKLQTLVDLYKD